MGVRTSGVQYTSILSILDDIHSMVPDIDWDEARMLEWVMKGYRKLNVTTKYEEVVTFIPIIGHRGDLPVDLKYINQMFFRLGTSTLTEEESLFIGELTGITDDKPFYRLMTNTEDFFDRIADANGFFTRWYNPLRKYQGHFGFFPCTQDIPRANCEHHYVEEDGFITTSFKNGCVILSYKRYIQDAQGLDMIPNDEVLKDALFHFCMYRFWLGRSMAHEQGSIQQYRFHLEMYDHHGKRAVSRLNMPDVDTMENMKNLTQRILPRANMYDRAFSQLSNREKINFGISGKQIWYG